MLAALTAADIRAIGQPGEQRGYASRQQNAEAAHQVNCCQE
jgi:hypothetical protein